VDREVALRRVSCWEIDGVALTKRDRAIPPRLSDSSPAARRESRILLRLVGEESDTIGDVYEPYLLQKDSLPEPSAGQCCHGACVYTFGRARRARDVGHSSPDSQNSFHTERIEIMCAVSPTESDGDCLSDTRHRGRYSTATWLATKRQGLQSIGQLRQTVHHCLGKLTQNCGGSSAVLST